MAFVRSEGAATGADQPLSGADEVPAIFLSHSGKQKPFVEKLYDDLQSANHTAFFDQHTLPKGSPFPAHINRAARGCKLGVVVLSDDFLTSKWPMLELEMLVLQRGPDARVLPLFYKLHPQDLKCPKNLSNWRRVWEERVGQLHADEWERAVKALDAFNGEIFTQGTSEAAYIKRVVRSICNLVPSPTPYDLSPIQGHQRLAQEVARQFQHADATQCKEARVVGLHGIGGLGKTTMCTIMATFYNSEYPGRSLLLEFPTAGDHKVKIVKACKKALEKLTNLSKHLLKQADSFDQVVELMRKHLKQYDVFLAIDNVWESSREAAQRILGVGFSANSKVLLTSRSEQLLMDLLQRHTNTSVGPLPAPGHDEAFQIVQQNFLLGDLNSLVTNRNLLHSVLERCMFNGTYHALALKTLGKHVESVCKLEDSTKIEHHLYRILEEIRNADLLNLDDVIRLNYENLPEHKKHMFLDIVILTALEDQELTYVKARQWLRFLYKRFPEIKITRLIYELALDGLIQLEIHGQHADTIIRVHDLFSDLAHREAASSSRFFFTEVSNKSVEEIEWEKLERVFLGDDENPRFIEKLQQQECRKLQFLCAGGINFQGGIHLDLMPSLCVLMLESVTLGSIENWTAVTGLAFVFLSKLQCLKNLDGLSGLLQLEALHVEECASLKKMPDLSGLTRLERLELYENESMEEVGGLSSTLKDVSVTCCGALKKMPDLSGLTRLERLELYRNASMEEVGGLSSTLKDVSVVDCGALKKMPDLSGLTCLERLELHWNASMEEVGGLSSTLKDVSVVDCGALKKMPDLSGLTCLERLKLDWNESMEEVGGLSSTLKDVSVRSCRALKKMPDLSGLTCLERLELDENESMEEVGGLSSTLKDVSVRRCGALKKMPDLSGLTRLERLALFKNASMEEVGGLSSTLKDVSVTYCGALKKIPDLSGLTRLERLELNGNESMEEVGGLSSTLEDVSVEDCGALKKMPDLSGLTCLERLELRWNASMEEVGGLSSTLKDVSVVDCGALKKMPDLSGLTCLERLELHRNASMEEVGGLSSTLKDVSVVDCGALKKMPDLSGLTCLERLTLHMNESMEEVGGLSSTLKDVSVRRCGALKKMPDLSGLTRLERLELRGNASMEEVGGLSSTLKDVSVRWCTALKKMPDLSGLTCLERLMLCNNESMEEVGGKYVSSTLSDLSVWGCSRVRSFPSLNECVHLQTLVAGACLINVVSLDKLCKLGKQLHRLELVGGKWTSWFSSDQWKGLTLLRNLRIQDSDSIKIDVGCLSPLTNLKCLEVRDCEALEEIGDLSALQSLEELQVHSCGSLKKLGGFMGILTHLRRLHLARCESLEESNIPDKSSLGDTMKVTILRCGNIPDMW